MHRWFAFCTTLCKIVFEFNIETRVSYVSGIIFERSQVRSELVILYSNNVETSLRFYR